MTAVGLDTLLAGATVECQTAQGQRGPEVSRILAIDFSTAALRNASFDRAGGNGSTAAGPSAHGLGTAASGLPVRALVKWFLPSKGYDFLELEDGSAHLFCHLTVVEASGHDTLPQGATVTCEVVRVEAVSSF